MSYIDFQTYKGRVVPFSPGDGIIDLDAVGCEVQFHIDGYDFSGVVVACDEKQVEYKVKIEEVSKSDKAGTRFASS
jgi:hypothetical protein